MNAQQTLVRPPLPAPSPRPPISHAALAPAPLTQDQYVRRLALEQAVRLHQGRNHGQAGTPSWFNDEVLESADRFTAWITSGQKERITPTSPAAVSEKFGTEPADRIH